MAKWHDECDKITQTHENAIMDAATSRAVGTLGITRSRCFMRASGRENDAQPYYGARGRLSHQKSVEAEVIRPLNYATKECNKRENQ